MVTYIIVYTNNHKMEHENNIAPVCCFLGHVDVGKTSLLDLLRKSNIQHNEAGQITQQIGSTYFNKSALNDITEGLSKSLEISSLLILDTPGHDCFTQMRLIGIKVSHLPILVVDIIKGLEKQGEQCIELLNKYKTQFIIALNKLDRIQGWNPTTSKSLKGAFPKQNKRTISSIKDYSNKIICQLNELGINSALYYENNDPKNIVSMVPVSARTGEGVADLMVLISKLTVKNLNKVLHIKDSIYNHSFGYIIETKQDEKHGQIVYALLLANSIKKGDKILIESITGNTVLATIKEILLPPDQKEMKNKISLKAISSIDGTCGIGIKFTDDKIYDEIAPGGIFMKYSNDKDIERIINEQIKNWEIYEEFKYDKIGIIINVPAKGMAFAILKLMQDGNKSIKIQDINIGKINKTTIIKGSSQLSSCKDNIDYLYNKRYAVILDYNNLYGDIVKYDEDIQELSEKMDVKIINGNIVHHLVNDYYKYIKSIDDSITKMYPNLINNYKLQILPKFIFLKKSPLMFGIKVLSGTLYLNTIICAQKDYKIKLGTVTSIQRKNKPVESATKNDEVCIRIEDDSAKYEFGKHFNEEWILLPYFDDNELKIRDRYPVLFN